MFSTRATAIAAGVFFLITHVTSVLAAFTFYPPVLTDPDYVLGTASDSPLLFGGLLEVILAAAIVGTSVALFPVVRRVSEGFAMGYVALRTLEAGVILFGVASLMTVATLHAAAATGDATSLVSASTAVQGIYTWAFLIGPGLICPINTVVLAVVMYRTGLVPRFIPVLGFIGAPAVFALNVAKMFGVFEGLPAWIAIGVVPLFAWEICLAVFLIARGFRPAALERIATSGRASSVPVLR